VIVPGARVLVCSTDPAVRGALMRASAGVCDDGMGRVVRPALEHLAFLPERPYLPPGTLREMMGASDGSVPLDGEMRSALLTMDAADLVERAEGIDLERDWEHVLTQHEQQVVALARVLVARPRFAFVDNLGRLAGDGRLSTVLAAFVERGITCVAFGSTDEPRASYDTVLVLAANGAWHVESAQPGDTGVLPGSGGSR
jgi:putative ATP-binding cassette transporter